MRRTTIPADKLRSRFAGRRFRRRCGAPGYPSIRPGPTVPKGGDTIVDLYCPHCLPPWEMRDARLDGPPWTSAPLAGGQQYAGPGCRRRVQSCCIRGRTRFRGAVRAGHISWSVTGGRQTERARSEPRKMVRTVAWGTTVLTPLSPPRRGIAKPWVDGASMSGLGNRWQVARIL